MRSPEQPLSNKPFYKWTSETSKAVNANQTAGSVDMTIKQTSSGTQINLKRKHKYITEQQWTEFDPDVYYDIGDEIRVIDGKTYTSSLGPTIPADVGTWKCVFNVPGALFTSGMYSDPNDILNYTRNPSVKYYPQSTEPANLPSASFADGRFWEKIGGGSSTSTPAGTWR